MSIDRPPPPRPPAASDPTIAFGSSSPWGSLAIAIVAIVGAVLVTYLILTHEPRPLYRCPSGLTLVNADSAWVCIEAVPAERTR